MSNQELIRELRSRFPIFDRVSGRFGESTPEERIPWFFALLLAAASKPEPGACCFVLDKTPGTAPLAAVFLALSRLQEEFPRLAENYARTALTEGQLVKVKPSDFVYEYMGVREEDTDQFWLTVQDRPERERRSFPVSDVLRLEPTFRRRPKGTLTSNLGVFDHSPLDQLLEITTYGNGSMIRNVVLICIAQARFSAISEVVSLARRDSKRCDLLSSFLPWGTIGPDGVIQPGDAYQVIGEPLIAVSRVPQDLVKAANSAPEASTVILVDGTSGILSDLQAFDDITDRQRVVILASPNEMENVRTLQGRGCPVWHLSPSEITLGEDQPGERSRNSLAGRTVRMADMRDRTRVVPIECQNDDLQAVAVALEVVAAKIDGAEEKSETEDLLARLYGILLEFSECCFEVGEEVKSDLRLARRNFARDRMWMTQDVSQEFQSAIDRLESISDGGSGRNGKADALLSVLVETEGRWAIACRLARTVDHLRAGLSALGSDVPVLPIRAIQPENEWDGIILAAWPNGRRFTRLRNLAATREIRILTYPFERMWLSSHQAREQTFIKANRMEAEDRAGILGIEPDLLPASKPVESTPPIGSASPGQPMLDFERRFSRRRPIRPSSGGHGDDVRSALLIEFYGGCYTLLTEWSPVHVMNDLMEGISQEGGLRTVAAADLSIDDFVLFRAGGDEEFIRLLAEDELGVEAYERVRAIAERWKSAIRRLGRTPQEVQRRLEENGLYRTLPTIAGWMGNPDRIGPGDDGDIEIIGRAANDAELLERLSSVRGAILKIRGAHQAAGSRLTQLILGEVRDRIGQLDDQPVLLDLGYGHAWVVQVQAVDSRQRKYSADQVNRLLWTDDSI